MRIKSSLLPFVLAIVHAVSGLSLLLFSSWFIAACAVAGIQFNYMLPAVVIRGLALLKIASGYGEMWLSHHDLLNKLATIRLKIFDNMQDQSSISRGCDTDKLQYQSNDVASLWAGWVNQNGAALLSLTLLTLWVLVELPPLSAPWCAFLVLSLGIYLWLLLSGLVLAEKKITIRAHLESTIEHHFDAASLWHMQKELIHPSSEDLYNIVNRSQKKIEWAISLLLAVSLFTMLLILLKVDNIDGNSPVVIVVPMALLASIDWFGRTFYSHHRLQDYFSAKKSLNQHRDSHEKSRLLETIDHLELKMVKPLYSTSLPVSIRVQRNQRVLVSGSSGSGKTRLMQAIAGLIPYQGEKLVNHKSMKSQLLDDALYIEQQPYCLSGTLRQNILVANSSLNDDEINKALKQVGLGYLTDLSQWLGSEGRKLSGGEIKRLGMARAMVSTKSFLLIDEPFEGLDTQNIENIVNIINELSISRTVMIASHIFPEALMFDQHIHL